MGDADFLEVVTTTVRELVLEDFIVTSCIPTTRILIDVLDYFGISGKPIPVEVLIFNKEARTILDEKGITAVAEAVQAREPEDVGGPWTIGLGVTVQERQEGGHVVVGIPSQQVIIDGSLDQAARPLKDIHLKASPIPMPEPDFFTKVGTVVALTAQPESHGPVLLVYTHSRYKQYLNSPNWFRKSAVGGDEVFRHVTAQAIRGIKTSGVSPT